MKEINYWEKYREERYKVWPYTFEQIMVNTPEDEYSLIISSMLEFTPLLNDLYDHPYDKSYYDIVMEKFDYYMGKLKAITDPIHNKLSQTISLSGEEVARIVRERP